MPPLPTFQFTIAKKLTPSRVKDDSMINILTVCPSKALICSVMYTIALIVAPPLPILGAGSTTLRTLVFGWISMFLWRIAHSKQNNDLILNKDFILS